MFSVIFKTVIIPNNSCIGIPHFSFAAKFLKVKNAFLITNGYIFFFYSLYSESNTIKADNVNPEFGSKQLKYLFGSIAQFSSVWDSSTLITHIIFFNLFTVKTSISLSLNVAHLFYSQNLMADCFCLTHWLFGVDQTVFHVLYEFIIFIQTRPPFKCLLSPMS